MMGQHSNATVRSFAADDASAYVELLRRLDRESTFLLWEPGERSIEPSVLRQRSEQSDRADGVHLVADASGELVGFLVAYRGHGRRIQHRADFAMAVVAAHQGRGIGHRLLTALDAWAAEVGVSRLELTVMAHNERAIALYERAGYAREGVKREAIRVDGRSVDELVMGKLLG
jgi:RimJ/RimL family protein N-acetyltransferase